MKKQSAGLGPCIPWVSLAYLRTTTSAPHTISIPIASFRPSSELSSSNLHNSTVNRSATWIPSLCIPLGTRSTVCFDVRQLCELLRLSEPHPSKTDRHASARKVQRSSDATPREPASSSRSHLTLPSEFRLNRVIQHSSQGGSLRLSSIGDFGRVSFGAFQISGIANRLRSSHPLAAP
jgi:hypothetical protein